jgi:hypothetical protein
LDHDFIASFCIRAKMKGNRLSGIAISFIHMVLALVPIIIVKLKDILGASCIGI